MYKTLDCVKPEIIDVSGMSIEELGTQLEGLVVPLLEGDPLPRHSLLW